MIKYLLKNPNAMHYLVAGVTDEVNIELDGSVGYFTGTMCDGPKLKSMVMQDGLLEII